MANVNQKKKRSTKITAVQQGLYVEMLKSNVAFRTNKNTPSSPNAIEEAWNELAALLNSCGSGPQKTKEHWKKTFVNWRSVTKKKARNQYIHTRGTGGGPASEATLTVLENELVNVLGNVVVVGAEHLNEAGILIEPMPTADEPDPIVHAADVILSGVSSPIRSESPLPVVTTISQPGSSQGIFMQKPEEEQTIPAPKTRPMKRKRQCSHQPAYEKAVQQYAETVQVEKESAAKLSDAVQKLAESIDSYTEMKRAEIDVRKQELELKWLQFKLANPNFTNNSD